MFNYAAPLINIFVTVCCLQFLTISCSVYYFAHNTSFAFHLSGGAG